MTEGADANMAAGVITASESVRNNNSRGEDKASAQQKQKNRRGKGGGGSPITTPEFDVDGDGDGDGESVGNTLGMNSAVLDEWLEEELREVEGESNKEFLSSSSPRSGNRTTGSPKASPQKTRGRYQDLQEASLTGILNGDEQDGNDENDDKSARTQHTNHTQSTPRSNNNAIDPTSPDQSRDSQSERKSRGRDNNNREDRDDRDNRDGQQQRSPRERSVSRKSRNKVRSNASHSNAPTGPRHVRVHAGMLAFLDASSWEGVNFSPYDRHTHIAALSPRSKDRNAPRLPVHASHASQLPVLDCFEELAYNAGTGAGLSEGKDTNTNHTHTSKSGAAIKKKGNWPDIVVTSDNSDHNNNGHGREQQHEAESANSNSNSNQEGKNGGGGRRQAEPFSPDPLTPPPKINVNHVNNGNNGNQSGNQSGLSRSISPVDREVMFVKCAPELTQKQRSLLLCTLLSDVARTLILNVSVLARHAATGKAVRKVDLASLFGAPVRQCVWVTLYV